ncbi:MAG: acetyl-CoA carboxylase biotin carboxylase subunit [bacterium]|jgi:acetyl-CoA carboxylase biotin carboxylase subunit|nr:acetyl-CoA carboxylase biotin carboxylase subunit [candidate division KSB1 bacterium]MDH7559211.1 acetyl-CoA carboxylase biotin carboxylase subunit [bacterium]
MVSKVLVANRGEIAVRVIRACRELGVETVAVYSEADEDALHVQLVDQAVCLGPAPPLQSYLRVDAVIAAARHTGADAIHPGYGFLAENAAFAQRCEQEGITFVGPCSAALALVGDKVAARATVARAGVPTIPGMLLKTTELSVLTSEAEALGYPLLVKASAGGGGKGMRLVRHRGELRAALEAGIREAESAFGDGSLYLEKYLEEPRHVEFQVLADHHGHAVHLYERECSMQRRYQKVVEESPSPALDDDLRQRMADAAPKVVKACSYTNAGTVEFLLGKDGTFYFLEVNARIQVEHPVTESVTGVDLVRQQLLIASGEPLHLRQEQITQRGHAIECRIYAEDPAHDFLPCPGTLLALQEPRGAGVRTDSGLFPGCQVSVHYDPLSAKVIAWGQDREQARRRMVAALQEYVILGVRTEIPFLRAIMNQPAFVAGETTTAFLARFMDELLRAASDKEAQLDALLAAAVAEFERRRTARSGTPKEITPWQRIGRWKVGMAH